MTIEEALVIVEAGLEGRLSRIQELVFCQVWEGLSYSEVAEKCGYDVGYVKNVASQLWRLLSKAFGEKVTKSNFQSVLKRRPSQTSGVVPVSVTSDDTTNLLNVTANLSDSPATVAKLHRDWGGAIDTSLFYGRTEELSTLRQWVVNDRCRLVTLSGMGGIGKSALAVKLAQHVENQFEYVIWRSLRNTPSVEELLVDLIKFLDKEHQNDLPNNTAYLIVRLIELLRKQRCLLILDNVESILHPGSSPEAEFVPYPTKNRNSYVQQECLRGTTNTKRDHYSALSISAATLVAERDSIASKALGRREELYVSRDANPSRYILRAGCYLQGYEGYGELFRQIGEASHQSCLVITSREHPKDIAILEGESRPVRSLRLRGLGLLEAKELLNTKGLTSSEDELRQLVEYYEGNPLALMIVSETIKELFNGKIYDFFLQNSLIFGELYELLEQQFSRLSKFEKEILYCLTLNGVPVSLTNLFEELLSSTPKQVLMETLCALRRRSLVEVSHGDSVLFTLKPLVREYIIHRFTQES